MRMKIGILIEALESGLHVYKNYDGIYIARSYNVSEQQECAMVDKYDNVMIKPDYLESVIWAY